MIDDDLRHGDRGRLDREEEEEMRLYNQSAPRYVNSSASRRPTLTALVQPQRLRFRLWARWYFPRGQRRRRRRRSAIRRQRAGCDASRGS
jgi:hypothetical protein